MKYVLNTKKSPEDNRDFLNRVKVSNLPNKYTIKHNLPIRDQKNVGSCMSHAAVRAIEIQLLNKRKWAIEGSELYHYYAVRKEIANTFPEDSGMTVRDGCKGMQKFGASLEMLWPYDTKKFNTEPSKVAKWLSTITKASSYYKVLDIETIKDYLCKDVSIVCGVFVDREYYKMCNNSGISKWYPEGKSMGGHAQNIIGYDDTTQELIIENSWGKSFGNKGCYRINYSDFKKVSFDWYAILL